MAINFENQVVLVTGGTRGLGREFSLCLGASGATVAVNSTTSEDAGVIDTITGSGGQAAHFAGLVEHPDSLVEAVIERFGRLDAIIHNAGFVRDKTLRKMTDEQWQEVIDVHLSAAFKLTRA
ncbi:MAG: SDR family NAD(P)-dependent oxidoreductase, partial [Gammaproteobacteria bacterium]